MIFASRLPASLDFILPKRFGFALFSLAYAVLERDLFRSAFSVVATVALSGSVLYMTWLTTREARENRWSPSSFLTRGFKAAVAVLLFRWSASLWFEVSQTVFFPYGCLNPAEPFANAGVLFGLLWALGRAVRSFLSAEPAPAALVVGGWAGANLFASLLAFGFFNAFTGPLTREGSLRRSFVVLTEDGGKPSQAVYDLPVDAASRREGLLRLASSPGVQRLPALRALYEADAKALDPETLDADLRLGAAADDGLARSLILERALAAPPSPARAAAVDALADERAVRVGPLGAARLARAFARLGRPADADAWGRRAEEGPRGIPRGLLGLEAAGPATGRVSGRVSGLVPARVALYRKSDPAAAYGLDAGALAAATAPGPEGRFSFAGLPAGRYYLAFSLESPEGELRVLGHRGDLVLDARRPSIDLAPLTLKASR